MLTRNDIYTTCIKTPANRQVFKSHMCGLCYTLGNFYGHVYSMLTNDEMTLLSMLVCAQRSEDPMFLNCRCPLHPTRKVNAVSDISTQFSAAASVALTKTMCEDHIKDSDGIKFVDRFVNWLMCTPYKTALQMLKGMGFDVKALQQLGKMQATVENNSHINPTMPTSLMGSQLFTMTALLAGVPKNTHTLSTIGFHFGNYVYLRDAVQDFPKDVESNKYNPLRCFSTKSETAITLSTDGLAWLLDSLAQSLKCIRNSVNGLKIHRYDTLIKSMLCDPIKNLICRLSELQRLRQGLNYHRWRISDIAKTAFFMVPEDNNYWFGKQTVDVGPCSPSYVDRGTHSCNPCSNEVVVKDPCDPCDLGTVAEKDPCNPCSTDYKVKRKAGPCD